MEHMIEQLQLENARLCTEIEVLQEQMRGLERDNDRLLDKLAQQEERANRFESFYGNLRVDLAKQEAKREAMQSRDTDSPHSSSSGSNGYHRLQRNGNL